MTRGTSASQNLQRAARETAPAAQVLNFIGQLRALLSNQSFVGLRA